MADLTSALAKLLSGGKRFNTVADQARASGLTSKELASRTGMSQRSAQRYLAGRQVPKSSAVRDQIQRAGREGAARPAIDSMRNRPIRITATQGPKGPPSQVDKYERPRSISLSLDSGQVSRVRNAYASGDIDGAVSILRGAAQAKYGEPAGAPWVIRDVRGIDF